MAIEIIEVITLQEYRAAGFGIDYDDRKVKEAINTAFLQLNSVCDHNISKRWNLPDTDPLHIPEDKKKYAQEAFCLQTTWNLKNNLNMGSIGSQQESLGSWSHSYNNPKEKEVICPGVLDLLQQAGLYKSVVGKSMNVLNRHCGIPLFGHEPIEGDVADLAFVRWGDANNKFLAKYQGSTYANKILYIDTNGYIRLKDINDFNLVNYQKIIDEALLTTDKTIVGAINELFATTPSLIHWDTTPTAEHGDGYAVTSEGIKIYVDNKETNLQSQITTLENDKQSKTDTALDTTDKTVVGAINELRTDLWLLNNRNPIYQHTIFLRAGNSFNFSVKFTNNSNGTYGYNAVCRELARLNPIQALTGTTGFSILQTFNNANNDLYYIAYVDATDTENIKWYFKKVGNNNWLNVETELGEVSLSTQTTVNITQ